MSSAAELHDCSKERSIKGLVLCRAQRDRSLYSLRFPRVEFDVLQGGQSSYLWSRQYFAAQYMYFL